MPEKTVPHNIDAEQSVLGSMFLTKKALQKSLEGLISEDFYLDSHQKIFEAIKTVSDEGKAVDHTTVIEELTKRNWLQQVGGIEYIVEMIPKIIIKIKSDLVADRDFVNFLCSLIQIEAEDRPNFEEIYRNKWVNKNADYISKITKCFGNDEQKLIKELRKSDYLYEKTQELSKIKRRKFVFNKKINNKTVFKRNNILK